MSEKKMLPCPLCKLHQKLETMDGVAFWIEWSGEGYPKLCTDTRSRGGGTNVLGINYCPLCGQECETITVRGKRNDGKKEEYPGVLPGKPDEAGTETVSRR